MDGRCTSFVLVVFAVTCLAASVSVGEVTIDQKPVVVERKSFDPAHRPAEMPAMKPGEAAVTESRFDCAADLSYRIVERSSNDSGCTVSVRVQMIHLTLSLKVLVWVPNAAPAKLVAHEDGHRRIDERIYDESKSLAEREGRLLDGQLTTGSAADCTAAEKKATQSAAEGICKRYLETVGRRAEKINACYDSITGHGTKISPAEDKAIVQAFDCER